jgi:hypothetical protein
VKRISLAKIAKNAKKNFDSPNLGDLGESFSGSGKTTWHPA